MAEPVKRSSGGLIKKLYKENTGRTDYTILLLTLILVFFGIIMVFSSSYYYALEHPKISDMYYFVKRQAMYAAIGGVGMAITINFPYRYYKKLAPIGYVLTNLLLILVLVLATATKGSKRWLFGFQPSELSKVAVILFLALYISTHRESLNNFKGFLKAFIILAIPVALIGAANMSTAIVVFAVGIAMLFVASKKLWYFVVGGAAAGAMGCAALFLPMFAYRMNRIRIWRDPFSDPTYLGFQTIQSLYAIASGGLFGLGLGQSRQKTFIPEPYNDFIFSIICEELGLVGAAAVILVFGMLVWRGVRVAMNARDMFGCLIATGITALIAVQVIINISVATNTMPNTGIALPFISFGGTSLVILMMAVGILINVSRYGKKE